MSLSDNLEPLINFFGLSGLLLGSIDVENVTDVMYGPTGIMDEVTIAYILFGLAVVPMVIWLFQMFFYVLSLYFSRFRMHRPKTPADLIGEPPGVSILKPLMGVDPYLEGNLESHFALDYPKFELLLCVQDEQDPVLALIAKLRQRFPNVDCQLFIGGKDGVINPMVHNMAPGYENAKYDLIWVSTSRIKASNDVIYDMVVRCQDPYVAICHQMPFMMNDQVGGLAAVVEKCYFGCSMARNYLALNVAGTHCFTGMSYIVKKKELDEVGGLVHFGKYLAEDFFLSKALHNQGYLQKVSAIPAQQVVATASVVAYKDRMVRWLRLRLNMMTFVAAVLEPISECLPLGMYTAWALNYIFDTNPYVFFLCHVLLWICLDYRQIRQIQGYKLPFSKFIFVAGWLTRELLVFIVYFEALSNPRRISWGKRTYRVTLGGHTSIVTSKPLLPL